MAKTEPDNPGTALQTIPKDRFPALLGDANNVIEALRENLGGERLTERDLSSILVPAGGATTWEIPGLVGVTETKTLEGVIVYTRNTRAYWPKGLDEGNRVSSDKIPDCTSKDGLFGVGDPGGSCELCPLAQWESGKGGVGQACKAMRQLFIVREQGLLPFVLTLPPTSLKPARDYLLSLAREGVTYRACVTAITLEQKTKDGNKWAEARFAFVGPLDPDIAEQTKAYSDAMAGTFATMAVVPDAEPASDNGDLADDQAYAADDPASGF